MSSLTLTHGTDPAMVPRMGITFSYDAVEGALAEVFQVPEEKLKALKARLRHFTNLGLAPADRPGKGKRIRYTFEDAVWWMLALEITSLGLSPQPTVGAITAAKPAVQATLWRVMLPTRPGERREQAHGILHLGPLFSDLVEFEVFPKADYDANHVETKLAPLEPRGPLHHLTTFNLADRLHRLFESLVKFSGTPREMLLVDILERRPIRPDVDDQGKLL